MSRGLAILLAVAAGCLVGLQAPVNARLGRQVGSLQAATVSFLLGTLALMLVASLSSGGLSPIGSAAKAPWWALIGGIFGAFYVTVALLTVRTLGVSGLTAIVVTGQLAIAAVVDRFGLLGIPRQHLAASRVAGLVLLVIGVVLVVRR
ncbi:MAG TPA: DMT family transporter [Solirubrobacteraceae bacterium]|nr:DMT family transporter [Solirubrobacteraceae bacterium]